MAVSIASKSTTTYNGLKIYESPVVIYLSYVLNCSIDEVHWIVYHISIDENEVMEVFSNNNKFLSRLSQFGWCVTYLYRMGFGIAYPNELI